MEQTKNEIRVYSSIVKMALDRISVIDRETDAITDGIAGRIDALMKEKGISKKKLAELTNHRPSDVTRWLGGGHNFTCKTIAIIQHALGAPIIEIAH